MTDLQKHSEIITVHDDNNNQRVEKKQIVGTNLGVGIVYLDRYPVRFYGLEVKINAKILNQVEAPDELNINSYYVDWDNGFIHFDIGNIKQITDVKYYGNTYTRISANRVYTVLDNAGNTVETIDTFIDSQKTKVDKKIEEFTITENIRKSNESTRKISETDRISSESTRRLTEADRQKKEIEREKAEAERKKTKNDLDGTVANAVAKDNALKATVIDSVNKNTSLKATVVDSVNKDNALKATIPIGNKSKVDLDASITIGNKSKTDLDASITIGNKSKTDLDGTVANSVAKDNALKASIVDSVAKDNALKASISIGNKSKVDLDASIASSIAKDTILKDTTVKAEAKKKDLDDLVGFKVSDYVTKTDLDNQTLSTLTTSNKITSLDNNATDGIMQVDSIKGRTLQNLCNLREAGASTGIPPNDAFARLNKSPNLAIGKTVTLINNNDKKIRYSLAINGAESVYHDVEAYKSKKVTLKNDEIMRFTIYFKRDGWTEINVKDSMGLILEGDYTTVNQPNYFEGIKSTGEEFSDVNLFDKYKVAFDSIVARDGTVKGGNTGWYSTDFISVKEGMEIRFNKVTGSTGAGLGLYSEKTLISWMSNTDLNAQGLKVRIPKGVNYIRASNHITSITVDNFIINQEEYKIEVLSAGKNIFDKSTITKGVIFIANSGGTSSKPDGYISDYINVVPNSKYIIKHGIGSSAYGHCFYSTDKNYVSGIVSSAGYDTPQVITTPNNCDYIRTSGVLVRLDTQQLEKSDILTSYEDFKSDKNEILLDVPPKGLPNGITDEIVGDRIYKQIEKKLLNGTEKWALEQNHPTKLGFNLQIGSKSSKGRDTINTINSNMADITVPEVIGNNSLEGIAHDSNYPVLRLSILKSKLTTPDLAGFQKWLSENPTEVYYELAEPTISTINPTSLKSFKDGSIILNNAITPIIDLKYPTSIGGRLASVESTLDDTVDRTKKLEEGLFTTAAQVIDNKEKITVLENANVIDKKDVDKIKSEVESARKGKSSLKLKIDEIEKQSIDNRNTLEHFQGDMDRIGEDITDNRDRMKALEAKTISNVDMVYSSSAVFKVIDKVPKIYKNGQFVFIPEFGFALDVVLSTKTKIATLPKGYRPVADCSFVIEEYNALQKRSAKIEIDKNGVIYATNLISGASKYLGTLSFITLE